MSSTLVHIVCYQIRSNIPMASTKCASHIFIPIQEACTHLTLSFLPHLKVLITIFFSLVSYELIGGHVYLQGIIILSESSAHNQFLNLGKRFHLHHLYGIFYLDLQFQRIRTVISQSYFKLLVEDLRLESRFAFTTEYHHCHGPKGT